MLPAGSILRRAPAPALTLGLLLSVLLFSQSFLSCFPMPKIAAIAVLTGFAAAAALATAGRDFLRRAVRRPFAPPLAALISWMALGLARSRTPESFSLVFLPAAASAVAAFLAAEMASVACAGLPAPGAGVKSDDGFDGRRALLAAGAAGHALPLATPLSGEPGERRRLLFAFALAHGLCGAYAVLQHLGLDPLTWTVDYGPGRAFSTIGNPDFLGGQMALAIPVLAALAFATANAGQGAGGKHRQQSWRRLPIAKAGADGFGTSAAGIVGTGAALVFSVLGLVFAQTRSALIGVIAGGAVAAVFLFRAGRVPAIGKLRLSPTRTGSLAIITVFLVMYSFPRLNPAGISLPAQLASSLDLEQRSARQRFFWWSGAVHVFLAAPVAGHGTGDFARVFPAAARASAPSFYDLPPAFCDHPHNDYLYVLGEHGIIGLGLLLWLGTVWLRMLVKTIAGASGAGVRPASPDAGALAAGVLAGVVATAVHAIWNMPLTIQATIYPAAILLGLTCAGTYRCIQREPDGGAGSADGFDAEGKPGSRRGKSVNGFAVASLAGVLAAALAVAWRPAVLLTAQGYLNGARVLNENRQYAPGAYLARQTLRLTSAPWRTRFLLGGILYGQQYYSAALAEFSQDEIENPWGGDAILHRGKALRQMGKLDEAEAECRRALALIPNYADAAATIASLAWYRASEAGKAGRRGEAATQLRRARVWIAYALGFFPGNAEALRLLGFIELKEGRLERAGAAWERYVRAKPGDRAMKDRLVALRAEMDRRKSGGIGR